LYRCELNYWPIDASGASRQNVCGFEGIVSGPAEDQEGQPSRQLGRSMRNSSFCTSITPCPRAAGTPTGRSLFFGPVLTRQFHQSWKELRAVLLTILPFE